MTIIGPLSYDRKGWYVLIILAVILLLLSAPFLRGDPDTDEKAVNDLSPAMTALPANPPPQ